MRTLPVLRTLVDGGSIPARAAHCADAALRPGDPVGIGIGKPRYGGTGTAGTTSLLHFPSPELHTRRPRSPNGIRTVFGPRPVVRVSEKRGYGENAVTGKRGDDVGAHAGCVLAFVGVKR